MDTASTAPVAVNRDEEHLRQLATFHTVLAVIGGVFACFPLLHVGLGLMMMFDPSFFEKGHQAAQPPPPVFGLFFVVMGGVFVLLGWAMAVCTFLSGRYISRRCNRMFSIVVAALLCMFLPFGTLLGVFTLVVLCRDSVERLYQQSHFQGTGRT